MRLVFSTIRFRTRCHAHLKTKRAFFLFLSRGFNFHIEDGFGFGRRSVGRASCRASAFLVGAWLIVCLPPPQRGVPRVCMRDGLARVAVEKSLLAYCCSSLLFYVFQPNNGFFCSLVEVETAGWLAVRYFVFGVWCR